MAEPRSGRARRRLARSGLAGARLRDRRRGWPALGGSRSRRRDPLCWLDDLAASARQKHADRAALPGPADTLRPPLSPRMIPPGWERYPLRQGFAYTDNIRLRRGCSEMNSLPRPRPVVLCILDGWGERRRADDNAIELARAPNWHRLTARWPHAQLQASEHYVGLPDGQMGNSEVGHTNIGAGRVVLQDLPRIDAAIAEGKLAAMPALRDFIAKLKNGGGTAHVMGLMSPGGVHSHQRQIAALTRILADAGVSVAVNAFLDGRDTPPKSAASYVKQFAADVADLRDVRIVTICGRYYAMDRDKRWDRVDRAYRAIVSGAGERADNPVKAVEAAYARGETDEFVAPTAVIGYPGIRDGDGLLVANFRADRVREIAAAQVDTELFGIT